MNNGKERILNVLSSFTGRDGEPRGEREVYILKSMWLMMLSEFESAVKLKVESYIDELKRRDIKEIHVCVLIRNFHGNKEEKLTSNRIISFYKKSPSDIDYRNFTRDKVPKYKSRAIEKLFNNLGIFFNEHELTSLATLDGIASTRDSIAHGDIGVQITRRELETNLDHLVKVILLLDEKIRQN